MCVIQNDFLCTLKPACSFLYSSKCFKTLVSIQVCQLYRLLKITDLFYCYLYKCQKSLIAWALL